MTHPLQAMFDTAAVHLLCQNARSMDSDGCKYRDPNGLKCAVGCLIPDNAYDPSFDEAPDTRVSLLWNNPQFRAALEAGGVPDTHDALILLCDLQLAHDTADPSLWQQKLRTLAKAYELSTQALDDFERGVS
jgi:hypothetical protein